MVFDTAFGCRRLLKGWLVPKRAGSLGIGPAHARTEVITLIHNYEATIITTDGTVLSEHTLNPKRGYQPQRKNG